MELQNHCMCSKVRCASIGALDHCTPIPWGGSQVHQEVPLGLQSLVLGLQVVLLVLQDILVVEAPELEKVLLGIPDVQNVLQVLRVLHNGHHMAAEGEPVGGRHIVEAPLGLEVPQDTLGQMDLLGMIELEALLLVFEGGNQTGSCLLGREEDLQRSAGEHRELQMQQEQLQGEE